LHKNAGRDAAGRNRVAKALGVEANKADGFAEEAKKIMASLQPIPRAGIADDVANAAVFLASDDSTFINGHDLVVDGGVIGGRCGHRTSRACRRCARPSAWRSSRRAAR
jgi:NAD(P)-dependent dehydrogenase (short-subunit alcohol dehydrogenase family)